jgi:dipeptidyl aminopeptidase/acylaminoacyl peptidase
MKLLAIFALAGAFAIQAAPPATSGRVSRTWTASDGKSMQAELLEFSDKEVKLKRSTDFQIVKVPLDRLGEADRKMILKMVHKQALDTGLTAGPYAEQITGKFVQGKSKQGLNYQLYGNPAWDGTKRYPLVIWLHGSGQSGNDNTSQMGGATGVFTKPENQQEHACFLLAPQCPDAAIGWKNEVAQNLMALIADLADKLPIDQDRLYLTGSSMGGSGTWSILAKWPSVFACGVVLCGGGDPKTAETIKHIPIWVFHGDKDDMVPVERARTMFAALKAVNGNIQYTELPDTGHNIAGIVYPKQDLREWMFTQRKGGTSASTADATPAATKAP